MRKSFALEITIVVLLLAAAFTYQVMRKKAQEINLVPEEMPALPQQRVKPPLIEEDSTPIPKLDRQELVKKFLGNEKIKVPDRFDEQVSLLGRRPDWQNLDAWQESITKEDFERLLTEVYTVGDHWKKWIAIHDDHAAIRVSNKEEEYFQLRFSETNTSSPFRYWKSATQLPFAAGSGLSEGKELQGVNIAIDPGHIGGSWAKLEERYFKIGDGKPVCEGNMTLRTGMHLKKLLESRGASVTMIRDKLDPLNPHEPKDYTNYAFNRMKAKNDILTTGGLPRLQKLRELLFYRTAEIRVRARVINEVVKPDLVICLHYNAEAWGNPEVPRLVEVNHFHIILHGAFTAGELAKEDERYSMLSKLLQRVYEEEAALTEVVATTFAKETKLKAYQYEKNSKRAVNVNGNPYLWARNLLANRLYNCPVLYMEPYVMNSREVYDRVQLGDYEGFKMVGGEEKRSIMREYAHALSDGVVQYYKDHRGGTHSTAGEQPEPSEAIEEGAESTSRADKSKEKAGSNE